MVRIGWNNYDDDDSVLMTTYITLTSISSPVVLHISSIKFMAPASPHKCISSACSPKIIFHSVRNTNETNKSCEFYIRLDSKPVMNISLYLWSSF